MAGTLDGFEMLLSAAEITTRVEDLGREIWSYYRDSDVSRIHAVQLLYGATIFYSDLVRAISRASNHALDIRFNGIRAHSYNGDHSQGTVTFDDQDITRLQKSVPGQHVLLIDDIADTRLTLRDTKALFEGLSVASMRICVLLDKESRKQHDVELNHVGFKIQDRFVIGCGLDYDGRGRHLDYIAAQK